MPEKDVQLKLFRKRDIIVYGLLIGIFVLTLLSLSDTGSKSQISVRINGIESYQFSITDSGTRSIQSDSRHLMDLIIKDGDVYIKNSECPQHLCERDHLSDTGVLVCVPQKVLITFEDDIAVDPSKEVDLVTR